MSSENKGGNKMKLDVVSEMKHEAKKLARDYEFGPLVKDRSLEEEKFDEFNIRKNNIALNALTMSVVGKNETKKAAEEVMEALVETQQSIMKLQPKAKKINTDIEIITLGLKKVITGKKITIQDLKSHANQAIGQIEILEKKNKKIKSNIEELKNFIKMPFDEETGLGDAIEYYEMIVKEYDKQRVRNVELEEIIHKFVKVIDGAVSEWEVNLDIIDEIKDEENQTFPTEVKDFIMTKIVNKRDFTAFFNMCGDASSVRVLKDHIKHFNVTTYGTENDLFLCKEAEENGLDFVGKGGIDDMDNYCFDITFNFINQFTFETKETMLRMSKSEDLQVLYPNNKQIPKQGSYVIFNFPFYLLRGKVLNWISLYFTFTIEDCYRVDDALKNVLIVARYRKGKDSYRHIYDSIRFNYDELAHYTDMKPIDISEGKVTIPEKFVPTIREAEDFEAAFPEEMGDAIVNQINEKYTPEEKAVELRSPLQEYKEGHLSAVACSEIVNNIYHGKDKNGETILYSAKIVKQQLEEIVEEVKNGEKKKFLFLRNKNIIVSKSGRSNGEIIKLIETK